MRMLLFNRLLFLFLILAAGLAVHETVMAGNLLVYTNSDSGAGSLRQAIANNAALGGGNNTVFSNGIASPITLGSELLIANDVSIVGPGDKVLTVSGNGAVSVFHVTSIFTGSLTVSISGLTIADGFTAAFGGGIFQES